MTDSLLQDLLDLVKSRYFGLYRGTVVDSADPTERARLQVSVPAVLDDKLVWAMPCVPYAGAGVGFYTLPPAGTGVWVQFEGGDPSYPVWNGFFWADGELPDDSSEHIKILKTNNLTLRLDDSGNEILINANDSAEIIVSDKVEQSVGSTTHTTDSNGVVSASSGTGKVDISSSGVSVNNGAWEVS